MLNPTLKEAFLKKEYGIGGRSHALSGAMGSSEEHDGKGMKLEKKGCPTVNLSWSKVAERITALIESGQYLSAQEQAQFDKIQEEKALAEEEEQASPGAGYDLGYGHLGNGIAVWNRLEEEHGDYKTVAHIAPDRTVTIYDDEMPQTVRDEIQRIADTSQMTISTTQDAPVFSVPPREQEQPEMFQRTSEQYPPDTEPYIYCEWSESPVFADETRYNVGEFDALMKHADEERVAGAKAALEKYGTWEKWYEADDPENARFLAYDKVKFTVVMPDGTTYTERQDIGDGDGGVLDFLSQYPTYRAILPALREAAAQHQSAQESNSNVPTHAEQEDMYRLLDRLKVDCEYFLGVGGRAEKHLWAGNVREQIAKMRELYDALPEKPEWLTMEDIDRYAQRMEPPYEVVVYHHFENGFDERLDYQTLAEAEQAAQKYMAGTMEGEDGFAYDGAGIYDLQENRWLRVYGNFPDERAMEQSAQALAEEQQRENEPVQTKVEEPAAYADLVGKELTMDGHRFVVERVSDVSGDVTLRDVTFEGNVGFPISRVEKVARVRELFQEQEQAQPQKEEPAMLPPKRPRRERITFTTLHPEIPRDQRHDFHITDDALGHGTPSEKYAANAAAIRTLKQIEAEERLATPEEQEILSRYVGWGGLADCFEETSPHYEELKSLLDSEEYAAARASTLTAFYTPPVVIRGIYKALAQMGFTQGNILEPSCGTGNFLGLLPADMAGSKAYGVELDSISGRIAGQLYQNASIS